MAKAKTKTEAVEAAVPATQAANLPAVAGVDYSSYAGAGSENVTAKDLLIPEIKLLQKMSPQVDKDDGAYLQGAEPGMFLDTATRRLFGGKDGLLIVPCWYSKHFIEFVPRASGGGFVADHGADESVLPETTITTNSEGKQVRVVVGSGNEIVETHQYAALVVSPDGSAIDPVLLRFASTKIKRAKQLTTLINRKKFTEGKQAGRPCPSFMFVYRMVAVVDENTFGKFYNVDIADHGAVSAVFPDKEAQIFEASTALYTAMKSGTAKTQSFGDSTEETDEVPF